MKTFFRSELIAICLLTIIIFGCSSQPAIHYQELVQDHDGNNVGLDKDDIVFGYAPTTLIISNSASSKSSGSAQNDKPAPALKGKKPVKNKPASDECNEANWQACLNGVTVASVSENSGIINKKDAYVGKPRNGFFERLWYGETQLFPQYVDNQEGKLKSLKIGYINKLGQTIASAALGAATGSAFGPYGIAAGAVLGAASQNIRTMGGYDPCEKAQKSFAEKTWILDKTAKPLPEKIILYSSDLKETECNNEWHFLNLTNSKGDTVKPEKNSGWMYRILETPEFVQSAYKTSYKVSYLKNNDYQESFPVPACKRMKIEITWWKKLEGKIDAEKPLRMPYPVLIADLNKVEEIPIPENGGIITPMTICGANVSNDGASAPNNTFEELMKGIDSVRKVKPTASYGKN